MTKVNRKKNGGSYYRSKNGHITISKEWSIVGKVVLITGANTGIGKATAMELVRRGAKRIILACQDVREGEKAAKEIREKRTLQSTTVVVRELDLSSNDSVRRFAAKILQSEKVINVLINNAGILGPSKRHLSVDGNELTLATNFLGHFLLTNLLLDLIKQSAPSRIVNVASSSMLIWLYSGGFHLWDDPNFQQSRYTWTAAYFQSKLCNILFTRCLHKRLAGSGVSTFTLHPGVVASNITRGFNYICRVLYPYFGKTPEQGAQTSIYCATEPGIEHLSSTYFINSVPRDPGSYDDDLAELVWRIGEQLTARKAKA